MNNHAIIILGGGMTGLSAAWNLEKKGFTYIVLIEGGARAGGKIETIKQDGFLVEKGPDSFIITKPYAIDLVHELGLDNELISPKTNRFFILDNNKFIRPPKGMNMMVPINLHAFLESKFFNWPAKHRILEESLIPPFLSDDDESFADFIERRFGEDMLNMYAGPLFTGIYATPAEELSMNATFRMLKKMEQQWGSITRAIKQQAPPAAGSGNRSGFMGLRSGMQTLSDTLISRLKHTRILLNTKALQIESRNKNDRLLFMVTDQNGEKYNTGNLIMTLPAYQAAKLMTGISPESGEILSSFPTS